MSSKESGVLVNSLRDPGSSETASESEEMDSSEKSRHVERERERLESLTWMLKKCALMNPL